MNLHHVRNETPETQHLIVNENENLPFTLYFFYLGSVSEFLLDDITGIIIWIIKENKATSGLKFTWNTLCVAINSKIKLLLAIWVNLASWNREAWSGNKNDLKLLWSFYHKAIRRMLGIHTKHAKEELIKNENVMRCFGGVKPLSYEWRCRFLKHVDRIACQSPAALPRSHLSLNVKGSLERGRTFRKPKDSTTESIRTLSHNIPETEKCHRT